MSSQRRYCAAVVLFHPEQHGSYCKTIESLLAAGVFPFVFDNSDPSVATDHLQLIRRQFSPTDVRYLTSGGNVGLAAAYNLILEAAESENYEGIIFLDQDSTVHPRSIEQLLSSYERVVSTTRVGVIAGMALRQDGVPYRLYRERKSLKEPQGLVKATMVPSSFSLVPFSAIARVGRFHDDFFIDHIDVDFCARCQQAGLLVALDPQATFPHKIGEGLVVIGGFAISPISAPFRHYFQTRNILLSARRRGASWHAAVKELVKRFIVIGIVGLWAGRLVARYRYAFRGLWDGCRNRGGPMPVKES